jgi:hypothetical protein
MVTVKLMTSFIGWNVPFASVCVPGVRGEFGHVPMACGLVESVGVMSQGVCSVGM